MRHSIACLDTEDLYLVEELVYRLLEGLLNSRPHGNSFEEYNGPIRFRAIYERSNTEARTTKPEVNFVFDFPETYISGLLVDDTGAASVVLSGNVIEGANPMDYASLVGCKVAQCLLIRSLHLKVCFDTQSGSAAVWWFRLPPSLGNR